MNLCSVIGCEKEVQARGFCNSHYQSFYKYGDPLKAKPTRYNYKESKDFIKNIIPNFDRDECLIWPFALQNQGYGVIGGKLVHRISCEIANGKMPIDKPHAAHSCGIRNCVNPKHLRWANAKENSQDRYEHGTMATGEKHHASKLKQEQVEEIRKLCTEGVPHSKISKLFGISIAQVSRLRNFKRWKENV